MNMSRLTWDPEGPAPYESAWSIFVKVRSLNYLRASEMQSLLSSDSGNFQREQAFISSNNWHLERISLLLGIERSRVDTAFLDCLGFAASSIFPYRVRHCAECRRIGYHCTLFNLEIVVNCPWHRLPLMPGCRQCAQIVFSNGRQGPLDRRYQCPHCGCYSGFPFLPKVNRVGREVAQYIEQYCADFVAWWRSAQTAAGELSPLLSSLALHDRNDISERRSWRLGWASNLSCLPEGWRFAHATTQTFAHAPIYMRNGHGDEKPVAELMQSYRTLYRAVRRAVYKAYVRPHAKCLRQLSSMGAFERQALDVERLCTVATAFLSWRSAHEGAPSANQASTPSMHLPDLRVATLEELWPCDDKAVSALLHANFMRIWADIEHIIDKSAVRIIRIKTRASLCDIPYVKSSAVAVVAVSLLVPCGRHLAERAMQRCARRHIERGLMCNPASVYANAGWNAVPDPHVLFAMKFHHKLFRNSYWHLSV